MSGFTGFFGSHDIMVNHSAIEQMSEKIAHRGKDGEKRYFASGGFCAATRLSKVEPGDSAGPISNEDKNLAIFFDGRIYNAKDLREELSAAGHEFSTQSDAEVALHGYEQHGDGIVGRLRGMFSFVIYDQEAEEIFGARDHFGVKPLYCYKSGELFMFGSEIKSFLSHPGFVKELNKDALKMYLVFQYSALEETFFKNVFRLPPGCHFSYRDGELKTARYFEPEYSAKKLSFGECADMLEKTLKDSIDLHTQSTGEIAGFLSGGVDSSFVVSVARPKKTFSVGFDAKGFDESMYAAALSDMLGLENHKKIVSPDEFFDILPKIQYLCDEPYANLSIVPLYYLSELASRQVKIALSGEGSDEFFAGYLPYADSRFANIYKKLPFGFRKFMKKLAAPLPNFKGKGMISKHGQKVDDYYIGQAFIMGDDEANELLCEGYRSNLSYKDVTAPHFERVKDKSELLKKMYLDLFLWMPNDIFLKADRMGAYHAIEAHMPILDTKVFATASIIPEKYLLKNKTTKYLFRFVAKKVLPKEWSKRKKLGFPVPFKLWLREQKYSDILKDMFEKDFAKEFFDTGRLMQMLEEHKSGKKNNARKLYTVYSFLLWHEAYFN
ncbi:MAG: asparagine synthase (glutamine-hydrolyzing) [Oscillospiraceae bacterium]|nr:asparagine synthase (glutamine-hydrolyzing) [Oscillospiraceae bacterium]